jgi:hypothetical protein
MCNVHESVKDCGATSYGVSVNHGTYTCIDPHQRLSIWHEFQYAKAVRLIVSCRVIRDEEYIFLHITFAQETSVSRIVCFATGSPAYHAITRHILPPLAEYLSASAIPAPITFFRVLSTVAVCGCVRVSISHTFVRTYSANSQSSANS